MAYNNHFHNQAIFPSVFEKTLSSLVLLTSVQFLTMKQSVNTTFLHEHQNNKTSSSTSKCIMSFLTKLNCGMKLSAELTHSWVVSIVQSAVAGEQRWLMSSSGWGKQ